jgi:hypothetical protein
MSAYGITSTRARKNIALRYWDYRIYVSTQTDDDFSYVISYAGEENLVIGTDYGHGGTSSEVNAISRFKAMEGLNPQVKRKILSDNPRRWDLKHHRLPKEFILFGTAEQGQSLVQPLFANIVCVRCECHELKTPPPGCTVDASALPTRLKRFGMTLRMGPDPKFPYSERRDGESLLQYVSCKHESESS